MSKKIIAYYNRGRKKLLKCEQVLFYENDEYLLNKIKEYKDKYGLTSSSIAIKEILNIALDIQERR